MDPKLLDVCTYEGDGYQALVDYGHWRVAILRFEEGLLPEKQTSMERHLQTDEIFVLTQGRGLLILGGNGSAVSTLESQEMEIGTVYNVRQNAWHTVWLSRDASVVLVENRDTSEHNSEVKTLSDGQRRIVYELSKRAERGEN